MAVVEKTIDIIGDDEFCKIIIGRKIPEGMPVDIYDETVKSLRNYAFHATEGLESANFPNVTTIGSQAFSDCPDLKSITFPKCTSCSGTYVFSNCYALESIDMPLLTYISDSGFSGCKKLVSVSLPSFTNSGRNLFASAFLLESVSLPRLISVSGYSFTSCNALRQLDLPSVTSIGEGILFASHAMEVVNIGPNITSIHSSAFSGTPDGMVINLPVAEGAISGAPWGATNAVINYEVPYSGDVPIPED